MGKIYRAPRSYVLFLVFFTLMSGGVSKPIFGMHPRIQFDELTHTADLIFVGTVGQTSSRFSINGNIILTDVRFENITIVHKRPAVSLNLKKGLVLTFAGGQVGDIALAVSGISRFEVGQRVLLFSLFDGQTFLDPLIGGSQGLFHVLSDSLNGREYILTSSRSGVISTRDGRLKLSAKIEKVENGTFTKKSLTSMLSMAQAPQIRSQKASVPQFAVTRKADKTAFTLTLDEFIDQIQATLAGPLPRNPVLSYFRDNSKSSEQSLVQKSSPHQLLDLYRRNPSYFDRPDYPTKESDGTNSPSSAPFPAMSAGKAPLGQDLSYCGAWDLPLVMEGRPTSAWESYENDSAMLTWNQYMDIYRWRAYNGGGGINFYSEFLGFITNSQLDDVYFISWGTALGMCMSYSIFSWCGELVESDVMFRAGIDWRLEMDETLGFADRYLYRTALMHELGHSWGMQRLLLGEDYDYDLPTVMHALYNSIVEDGKGIHVWDAQALRLNYDNQKTIIDINDLGVESYFASDGLNNARTDKWIEGFYGGGNYTSGETIVISGITVENMSNGNAPNVDVKLYLSGTRNGKTWPLSESLHFNNIPQDAMWVGNITATIPENVRTYGNYYITIEVTGNDGDVAWDDKLGNNITSMYDTISVTCPPIDSPSGLVASEGFTTSSIRLTFDQVVGAAYYELWRNDSSNPSTATMIIPNLVTTMWFDGEPSMVPGKSYFYWARTVNTCLNTSVFSSPAVGYIAFIPPVATASYGDFGTHIHVSWPVVTGATHYRVLVNTVYDVETAMPLSSWQTERSFDDMTAAPLTNYFYWVEAANNIHGNHASDLIEAYAGAGKRGLPPPAGLTASDSDETHPDYVRVTWDTVPLANYYRVYRSFYANPITAQPISDWITPTSFDDFLGAAGSVRYYFVQSCLNNQGVGAMELAGPEPGSRPALPLPSPTGVFATDGTDTDLVTVSWDSVPSATHYRVWKGRSYPPYFSLPISDWIPDTSFIHTTGYPGFTYCYFVTAAANDDGGQESELSGCNTGWRALLTPDWVDASEGESSDHVTITWSEVTGASYYQIYRSMTNDVGTAQAISSWQAGTTYDDADLLHSTYYYYWIGGATSSSGYHASELSTYSERGWRTLPSPVNIVASDGTYGDKIEVTWDAVPGATHYIISSSTVDNPNTASYYPQQTETSRSYTFVVSGDDYYFWVRAVVNGFISVFSEPEMGWRNYAAPTNVMATDIWSHHIRITWDPVADATDYRIFRHTSNIPEDAQLISPWIDGTTYDDQTSTAVQTYYYWVTSTGDAASGRANLLSIPDTGYRKLPAPSLSDASDGTYTDFISVTWDLIPEATHYMIWRSDTGEPHSKVPITDWIDVLPYYDLDTQAGHTYYYSVKAASDSSGGNASGGISPEDTGWKGFDSPSSLSASDGVSNEYIHLEWLPVPDAGFYRVYRHTSPKGQNAVPVSDPLAGTTFTDSHATTNVLYYYWVTASLDASGTAESGLGIYDTGWQGVDCTGEVEKPDPITGNAGVCSNDIGVHYAISTVSGVNGYTWTVPNGAVITSGQNTTDITVNFGSLSGDVSVTADFTCGKSNPQIKVVTVTPGPTQPLSIFGPTGFCTDETGVAYSIDAINGATGYTWTVPSGAVITSGQGSASIMVAHDSTSGHISVAMYNSCGSSELQRLAVTRIPIPDLPGPITGYAEVCPGETGVAYSTNVNPEATGYTWTVPADAVITSGQGTVSIVVAFGSNAGNVGVSADNACGSSSQTTLPIILKNPVTIVSHPFDQTVCQGGATQFSVTAQGSLPLTYQWYKDTLPLTGETDSALTIVDLIMDDAGFYSCEISNQCTMETSTGAFLSLDGPLAATFNPRVRALGLEDPIFILLLECAVPPLMQVNWATDPPTPFLATNETISLVPPPSQTTLINVSVTDSSARELTQGQAILLVPVNPIFLDFDQDGCNNLRDLWDLGLFWRSEYLDDPDGDGLITIQDLLYINLDDDMNCPLE